CILSTRPTTFSWAESLAGSHITTATANSAIRFLIARLLLPSRTEHLGPCLSSQDKPTRAFFPSQLLAGPPSVPTWRHRRQHRQASNSSSGRGRRNQGASSPTDLSPQRDGVSPSSLRSTRASADQETP